MRETYKEIPGTMCDFHAFYDAVVMAMPDGARMVEVGVADGHSAIYLAERMADLNKKFELYMIDSLDYGGRDQANTIIKNIIRSGLGQSITFLQSGSLDASCRWPDNWAHFVFLDSSHTYEQTKAEIRLWYRKVMYGHMLSGHDFNENEGAEVSKAVHEIVGFNSRLRVRTINTAKSLGVWSIKKETEEIC
jgi:cephalosporin hydroxylase